MVDKSAETDVFERLKQKALSFRDRRDWRQFHSPKNLVMGLAIETAELMEHFLWLDGEASRTLVNDEAKRRAVAEELADVGCHLLNLSNNLGIDLSDAIAAKIVKNAEKYPVARYRGKFE